MTIKDKILKYSYSKGLNINSFCRLMGISGSFFARNGGITTDILEAILNKCEDLSAEWLLRNEGEMIRKINTDDNQFDFSSLIYNDLMSRIDSLTRENERLRLKIEEKKDKM